jgi:hypothetical protein
MHTAQLAHREPPTVPTVTLVFPLEGRAHLTPESRSSFLAVWYRLRNTQPAIAQAFTDLCDAIGVKPSEVGFRVHPDTAARIDGAVIQYLRDRGLLIEDENPGDAHTDTAA